jgi:hypothetical protein
MVKEMPFFVTKDFAVASCFHSFFVLFFVYVLELQSLEEKAQECSSKKIRANRLVRLNSLPKKGTKEKIVSP